MKLEDLKGKTITEVRALATNYYVIHARNSDTICGKELEEIYVLRVDNDQLMIDRRYSDQEVREIYNEVTERVLETVAQKHGHMNLGLEEFIADAISPIFQEHEKVFKDWTITGANLDCVVIRVRRRYKTRDDILKIVRTVELAS